MTGGMVGARASSMIQDGEDRIGSRNGARVCRKWDRRGSSAPSVVENRWSSSERSRPVTSALETRRFVRLDRARETRNGSDFGESPTRICFLSGRTSKEKYGEVNEGEEKSAWYATAESNGSRLCTIDPRSAPNARIIERDESLGARKKRRGVAE